MNQNAWDIALSGATQNTTAIAFQKATVDWGTVTHVGIFDAATGGNMIAWAALTVAKAVGVDDTAEFSAGVISVTLD